MWEAVNALRPAPFAPTISLLFLSPLFSICHRIPPLRFSSAPCHHSPSFSSALSSNPRRRSLRTHDCALSHGQTLRPNLTNYFSLSLSLSPFSRSFSSSPSIFPTITVMFLTPSFSPRTFPIASSLFSNDILQGTSIFSLGQEIALLDSFIPRR